MKVVYDSLDESDKCPLYQMRVAMKPISLVMDENLECTNNEFLPSTIQMNSKNAGFEGEYQISSDILNKYMVDGRDLTYDVEIKITDEANNYYFDIETRYDFLTTEIEM